MLNIMAAWGNEKQMGLKQANQKDEEEKLENGMSIGSFETLHKFPEI